MINSGEERSIILTLHNTHSKGKGAREKDLHGMAAEVAVYLGTSVMRAIARVIHSSVSLLAPAR